MMPLLLNVGAGTNGEVPARYAGWRQDRLDIDVVVAPDILLDARELLTLAPAQYDAIYCSHNMEHYFLHDAKKVVAGFAHVLKPGGHAEVIVPDVGAVLTKVATEGLDMDAPLYRVPDGWICVRDILYGYHRMIERSGKEYQAHRNGFTEKTLVALLTGAGFSRMEVSHFHPYNLSVIAYL